MNLTTEPWIPALMPDGNQSMFSLNDLFDQSGHLLDLAVKPHERIAIMRLLVCITQAALDGPEDQDAWERCQPVIRSRVEAYLRKWRHAFELFGDGPRFLQLPNLSANDEAGEGTPATKLDLALASGNNSTLFDNSAADERSVQSSRSAINLLTFQCFSPGGRIGVAVWNGRPTSGNGSSNHAPCTPSSMAHTYFIGGTLLETISLNLLVKDQVNELPGRGWGCPVWERLPASSSDTRAIENATMTYLGRLVPVSRAVRLDSDGLSILLANGLDYPIFPAFREAAATVIRRKDELALLSASTGKSFWRQLSAIVAKRRASSDPTSGPVALNKLPDAEAFHLWVGAFVTDKAKIEEILESAYAIPPALFGEVGRLAYEQGVRYAEERESMMRKAVKAYAAELKSAPQGDRASRHYWTGVEQGLWSLFDLALKPVAKEEIPKTRWAEHVRRTARDAYDSSCPRITPRQIQAHAIGLSSLFYVPSEKRKANTRRL